MLIAFDFDGTIAKSTSYHKAGWKAVLRELNIDKSLDQLLPYEPNLKERFDSFRRIRNGFLEENLDIYDQIGSYFGTIDKEELTQRIMNLKESATIKAILEADTYKIVSLSALNLAAGLINLKDHGHSTAIISSTRKTIVSTFLSKTSILDLFDYIIGEEDLYDGNTLRDKPDKYPSKRLEHQSKEKMEYYIGDNELIDREFAANSNSRFILADYTSDMIEIVNSII
jgi:phosphoglycolate phosphatase-like HAD superfamily hydrolase